MKKKLSIRREINLCEHRPTCMKKDLSICKETYLYEKKPIYMAKYQTHQRAMLVRMHIQKNTYIYIYIYR